LRERCQSGRLGTAGDGVSPQGDRGFAPACAGRPENLGRIPHIMIMFYVYLLRSKKDGKLYIGSTSDLKRRFNEHVRGQVESTRNRTPLELLCYEAYQEKLIAERREKYLKSSDGHKDIEKRFG
jgi:putative endonuclease